MSKEFDATAAVVWTRHNQRPLTSPLWIIWDLREQRQVGKSYGDRRRATRRADKLDLEYGAIRYQVRKLNPEG